MNKIAIALLATLVFASPMIAAAQTEITAETSASAEPAAAPADPTGWNLELYNGYTLNGAWHYGPPPSDASGVELGFRTWRQGDRLNAYFLETFQEITDYRAEDLRAPARGFKYLRDGRGDVLYIVATTGVVQRVINR
jgi:Ni/Co efflux regulator RcnB